MRALRFVGPLRAEFAQPSRRDDAALYRGLTILILAAVVRLLF